VGRKIILALVACAIVAVSAFMLHRRATQSELAEAVAQYTSTNGAGPFEVEQQGLDCGSATDLCLQWKINLKRTFPLNASLKLADEADKNDFIGSLERSGITVTNDLDLDLYKDEYRSDRSSFCSSTCDVYILRDRNLHIIYLGIYEY
jgi:hypothetical protein